MASER